jgi:molecular chaperone GrpE
MPKAVKNKKKKNLSAKALELKNKQFVKEIEELKNKNISLLAEFDNYKRRLSKQMADSRKYEGKDALIKILPIIDDINRVLVSDNSDIQSTVQGIELIKNKFVSVLDDLGINSYDSIEKVFDPDYHEAIMIKKTKRKSNIVIEEYEKGYTYHDKVIRHAKVVVSE